MTKHAKTPMVKRLTIRWTGYDKSCLEELESGTGATGAEIVRFLILLASRNEALVAPLARQGSRLAEEFPDLAIPPKPTAAQEAASAIARAGAAVRAATAPPAPAPTPEPEAPSPAHPPTAAERLQADIARRASARATATPAASPPLALPPVPPLR